MLQQLGENIGPRRSDSSTNKVGGGTGRCSGWSEYKKGFKCRKGGGLQRIHAGVEVSVRSRSVDELISMSGRIEDDGRSSSIRCAGLEIGFCIFYLCNRCNKRSISCLEVTSIFSESLKLAKLLTPKKSAVCQVDARLAYKRSLQSNL